MGSALNIVDTDLALERAGGNQDLARDLFQMLQNELPNYLSSIQGHFESANHAALVEAVHKLNGASTYCGVPALKEAASTLESNLKQGNESSYAEGVALVLKEIRRLQQTPTLFS